MNGILLVRGKAITLCDGGSVEPRLKRGRIFPVRIVHLSRTWGSRHGGSFYSRGLVGHLLARGCEVILLAQEFLEWPGGLQCVELPGFFRRQMAGWPLRIADIIKVLKLALAVPATLVIVQGDLPRLTYVFLQFLVPLVFIRQDGILTCPGNDRLLRHSRSVCTRQAGLSCLAVHRSERCLGTLSWVKCVGRLAFRKRDLLLLRCLRHFVTCSAYLGQVHQRPARVIYPPRLSGSRGREFGAHTSQPGNPGVPEAHQRRPTPSLIDFPMRDLCRLVFCGRLEPVKGAADAIRIASLLSSEYHLDILGDGIEREDLEGLVDELKLGSRVKFLGWVDGATRDRVLKSAGVLLMPSLWDEGFGMAGLEALAQGTPVVAYNVGGIPEWCRPEVGVLVRCGDLRAAATAVRQLTQDTTRWGAYSRAAKLAAEAQFPRERFGRELVAVLHAVEF